MKYKIRLSEDGCSIIAVTSGKMAAEGFLKMAEDILLLKKGRGIKGVVFDHRELAFSHMQAEELDKIRKYHMDNNKRIGSGKSAIVLGKGRVSDWENIWSQGTKAKVSNRVKLFETLDEAVEWVKE